MAESKNRLTPDPKSEAERLLEASRAAALQGNCGAAWEDLHGAHALGSPEATYAIATWYLHGRHVDQDWVLAVQFLEQAAAAEWPDALSDLAICYATGKGKPKDPERALELYARAWQAGDGEAAYETGALLEQVRPGDAGLREAHGWYRRSAEAGYAEAQYAMGYAFENGHGVEQDTQQAIHWYRQAAAQGHEDAIQAVRDLSGKPKSPH